LLNQIHEICRQSVLNNLYSIPTDTPVFEKRGWTGDALLFSAQAADNFDVDRFFTKWMYDVADSQNGKGDIANIAPGVRQGSDAAWGSAVIFIPWRLYREYGDIGPIVQHYDTMKRYMVFLAGAAKNHLVNGTFGDWVSPSLTRGPAPPEGAELVDSAVYFRDAELMAKMAGLLGRTDDETAFSQLAAEIRQAFNASFLDAQTGEYHTGKPAGYRQTSNVVPVYFGITPPDQVGSVMTRLDQDIAQRQDHLDTGAFGTAALLPTLTQNGQVDLAYRIATQTTFPSWGDMLASGATTTLERWNPDPSTSRSRDHAFLGTVDDWLYKYVAGIQPAQAGYKAIEIRPYLPAGLEHAEASIDTPYGLVLSSWKRQAHGECILEVEIPPNTTAIIWLPGAASPVHAGSGLHRYTSQSAGRSL
jgi:alpha-L-rhamnosidase